MFKERLIELRKENKLTQAELADKLMFTRGQISNYELGQREPDFVTLDKIANFFHVSADYLLGRTDNPLLSTKGVVMEKVTELDKIVKNVDITLTVDGKPLSSEDHRMVRDMLNLVIERAKNNT